MNSFHFILLFALFIVRVENVECSRNQIRGYKNQLISDVTCWDGFGSTLNITGELPIGLVFRNNTFSGIPMSGSPLNPIYVFSQHDIQNPFVIYIGVFTEPLYVVIDMKDSVIVKNQFIYCIPVYGNTIFTSLSIFPELPQDMFIDRERGCIGGMYTGYLYGKQDYRITASNFFGTIDSIITLYYTPTSLQGLRGEYYSIHPDYTDIFRFLPVIPKEALQLKKQSVLHDVNYTTFDITSPFYSYGLTSIPTLYSVFSGFITFYQSGLYQFRIQYESEKDRVCNQFRMAIEGEVILDSWAESSTHSFEVLQSLYVDGVSMQTIRIEWLSSCPKVRPLHIMWKKPSTDEFVLLPPSILSHSMKNVLYYEESFSICRVKRFYSNTVVMDNMIINELMREQSNARISFSSSCALPEGLMLNEKDGSILGYPTNEIQQWTGDIYMEVNTYNSIYTFYTSLTLSVLGDKPTPESIIYYNNNTQVSEVNITVLEPLMLIPRSEMDYQYFTITPPLPSFLTLDPFTGIIEGSSLESIEPTRFVIQGESMNAVVNTVLVIAIYEEASQTNSTVVGGLLKGVHSTLQVIQAGAPILSKEVWGEEIVGCSVDSVYQVTVRHFKQFNWVTHDGLQFVLDNNVFVDHMINRTHSSISPIDTLFFSVNFTALERPAITIPMESYHVISGVSFPSISLSISQPHYPISISPALPATVSLLPRKDGQSGYILTGKFTHIGSYEYVITAFNHLGSDSVHLRVEVEASTNMNKLVIIDTCKQTPNITLSYNHKVIFERSLFASHENELALTEYYSGDFELTICDSTPMESYHVFLFLNFREPLFSDSIHPSSCTTHIFTIHPFTNVSSLWKYYNSFYSLPSEWTLLSYDDSLWPSNRNQFTLNAYNNILYLRHKFTFTWFDSALLLDLFILHREGIRFYVNGEEVYRGNTGYSNSEDDYATNIYGFPRYIRLALSTGLLQNGTNIFCARIHTHPYSLNKVDFNVVAHLIGSTKLLQTAPFPVIQATSDYAHANQIVNNYGDSHFFWSGRTNGSILSMEPFQGRSYINKVEITRSIDCIPDWIEIWGIFGDYEEEGSVVNRKTLLLQNRVLNWQRHTIEFTLNSRFAGYRGYQVMFGRKVGAANCVHIQQIDFYASKQVSCIRDSNVVSPGDSLRTRCPAGWVGVITQDCLQTGAGSSWGEAVSYCYSTQPQANHKKLWFTVILSSVSWEKQNLEELLVQKVQKMLKLEREAVHVYYQYMRQTTEFFLYKELYVFVDCAQVMRSSVEHVFLSQLNELSQYMLEEMNKEAVVQIVDVFAVEDKRLLICLWYGVPLAAILLLGFYIYVFLYRKKKEEIENIYLLS